MTMLTYTFLDQQNKLSSLLGDPNTSSDDMFPLAIRKQQLNMAEIQFAKDSKILKEYATGTVASSELAIPADWFETHILIVNNVVISNDKEIALADWERYYSESEESPYFYFWEFSGTRKMKFLGSACNGKTYYLYYFRIPTNALSADADISALPIQYREAPVYWAASELLEQIGKTDIATRYKDMYAAYVAQAELDQSKHYLKKEYPRPDFGTTNDDNTIARQGHGLLY